MKILTKNPLPGSIFALLLLITAIACKKDKAADLSGAFSVTKTDAYHFKQGDNIIATVTLTNIEDSRCPINANCTGPGYGTVTLKIKDLSIDKEQTITLYVGAGVPQSKKDLKEISLNGTTYILQLRDINPYPQVSMAPNKTALLVLTKM